MVTEQEDVKSKASRRVLGGMTAMLLTAAMIIGTGLFAALGETAARCSSSNQVHAV